MVSHHRHARRGGNTDDSGIAEDAQKVAHHGERFFLIAGVVVHLAAAGLRGAKFDSMPEPFENGNDSFAGFREKSVVVTSDEKRYEQ
jgi:hypothetical protein